MRKMRAFLGLACLVFMAGAGVCAEIIRGPYVESPASDSIIIHWRTDTPSMAWIEYGVSPNCADTMTVSPEGKSVEHVEKISYLPPGAEYCYKVFTPNADGQTSTASQQGRFKTSMPAEKDEFEFIVFGGSGYGGEDSLALIKQMENFKPDFFLHTGDIVDTGLDAYADAKFFTPYKNLLLTAPFYFTPGDADYGADKGDVSFLKKNYTPFHKMPWGPQSPQNFVFDWANARIAAVDTNSAAGYKAAPSLAKQVALVNSALSRGNLDWKFAILHHPVFSSGQNYGEIKAQLAPIFEKNNVDIVFQGHERSYERTFPIFDGQKAERGVTYISFGAGSKPPYAQIPQNEWSAKVFPEPHFAHIKVAGRKLQMQVYDKDGKVIDTLVLEK
ncbi:MAG: metallophosphoesterase [Elusimicrobia bacterium]|nr:metallophosphoesterase [Elusimicrobiota bacterium]